MKPLCNINITTDGKSFQAWVTHSSSKRAASLGNVSFDAVMEMAQDWVRKIDAEEAQKEVTRVTTRSPSMR